MPIFPSSNSDGSTHPIRVLAIVVVYKMLPGETTTLQTLLESQRMAPESLQLNILVADNTPGGQDPGPLPAGIRYFALPDNPGLARPYNEALALAEEEGYPWMLTLDQDTRLPVNFLPLLEKQARRYESDVRVSAIVPRIVDEGRIISPFRFVGGFLPYILSAQSRGIVGRFASALNSSSLFRVSALRKAGGYDPEFPLHNSDTRLYQLLDNAGGRVAIADEIVVQHSLSILQRQSRMSPERYRKLLEDECIFWDRHMGALGRSERLIRLLGRLCKGYLSHEDSSFQRITRAELLRRITVSRRRRMETSEISSL
jgi:GT2 family glycosyltransferase